MSLTEDARPRLAGFWRRHPFIFVPPVDTRLSRRRVLVSEWVDGTEFADVGRQPDPVRDRYAQIIYRFFYGSARELDVALGDPHPGNYLLCDDGRVAFVDFGMLRDLPKGYLRRDAAVFAAVRDSDGEALLAAMGELGYLHGDGEWNPAPLLSYMQAISWWIQSEGSIRLAPEDIWRGSESLRGQRNGEVVQQMRRMTLPPEALLLRRMEGVLFQVAATLRAQAPWGRLLRELVEAGEPVGELGEQSAAWLASRPA